MFGLFVNQCIDCQPLMQFSKHQTVHPEIRISAEIQKDDNWTKPNIIPAELEFVYHCCNACYKSYTMRKDS